MFSLRDDSGRLRASLRGTLPAFATLVAFVAALAVLGTALGDTESISPALGIALFLVQLVLYAALTVAALKLAARLERVGEPAIGAAVDPTSLRAFVAGAVASLVGVAGSLWWGDLRGLRTVDLSEFAVQSDAGPVAVAALLAVYAVYFLAGNVYEEVIYRRIALGTFAGGLAARGHSRRTAVVLATAASLLLFGIYHVPLRGNVIVAVDAALTGVTFAYAYLLTGNLALAVGVHFGRLPTVFAPGQTVAGVEVAPILELTDAALAANLEVRLVQIGLICLLVAAYHLANGGDLSVADSVVPRDETGSREP